MEDPENGDAAALTRSDVRPLVRAQLSAIRTEAEAAESSDPMTRYHLEDVVARIDAILE